MRYVLISSDESDLSVQDQRAAFDRKLEKCLSEPRPAAVVIQLRADMEPSIELLEWLERWTRRLSEERMRCVIVPLTPAQLECLELSHPDQNLLYAASIDEIGPLLPPGTESSAPASAEEPFFGLSPGSPDLRHLEETKTAIPDPVFQPDSSSSANLRSPDPSAAMPPLKKIPTGGPTFAAGLVATTSGEYSCTGCHISRMWLKGEQMLACVNPECLNPEAGWRLEWDLF
jgi:hypothetical protein